MEENRITEQSSAYDNLQRMSVHDILTGINREDARVHEAVRATIPVMERLVEQVSLREAIAALPERERQVIGLRFFHDMTQDAAARVIGVSQVQVSRLERRAVERLRELLTCE